LKNLLKSLIGGVLRPLNHYKKKDNLTIFCYHDVSDSPSEFSYKHDLNVPPKIFDYQVDFISRNFNVISPDDLLANKIPENAALITFDDGFKSYFETAVPILEKYNSSSIVFLNMAPIKGAIFWSGLITYLSANSSEFYSHVTTSTKCNLKEKPLFLYCSREIVNSFLKMKNKTFKHEIKGYVGNFATEKDLQSVSTNNLVFLVTISTIMMFLYYSQMKNY